MSVQKITRFEAYYICKIGIKVPFVCFKLLVIFLQTISYPYGFPHFNKLTKKSMKAINEIDERMFELYKILKSIGILKYKRDFANACGLPEQNLYNIKQGRNHFTINHVVNICKFYSINANWIVGNETNLFIKPVTQMLHKNALKAVI